VNARTEGLVANADGFHAAYALPLATGPSEAPFVGTNLWYSFIPIGG
jgi:hypothetical protein